MKHYFAFKSLFTLLLLMLSFGVGRADYIVTPYTGSFTPMTTDVILESGQFGKFTRWYFVDAATGQMIPNSAGYMQPLSDNWAALGCFYHSDFGLCVYRRLTAANALSPGNVRLLLPNGYSSWNDVRLIILSGSSTGVQSENEANVNPQIRN